MRTIDIMRGESLLVTIKPSSDSNQVKKIMGDNVVNIRFEDSRNLLFTINDWCTVFGERYQVVKMPVVRKLDSNFYEYELNIESEASLLGRALYMFLGDDNSLKESDFSLMGTADDFMNLLLQHANRVSPGWIKGQVIPTDHKNLTFSKEYCSGVLGRLAEAFETEWWVEGRTIHLTKRQTDTGRIFRHGKNKGLYEIVRTQVDSSSVVTRLYCYGSDKNLPPDYRNYSKRLRMTDGDLFVEKNTAKYGTIEYAEIIEDIYPQRISKVTSVNALNPYVFGDSTLDFNLNDQLLPGVAAKVIFNTGQLSGYEFEVGRFDNAIKEFTILQNKTERSIEVPSTTLKPAIGDEFILVDINMPSPYIVAAEAALKEKAMSILNEVSEPLLSYRIEFDPAYLRKNNYVPAIGQLVWLVDEDLQVEKKIRIISVTRNIVDEYDCKAEISDTVPVGTLSNLISVQTSNSRDITQINSNLQNNAIQNNNVIGNLTVKQGTIVFLDLPTTNTMTGFSDIVVKDSTGEIYRKV